MPIFVRLVSFTSEGHKAMKSFREKRAEYLASLKKLNIKLISEYVTTGKYDMVTVLDAPDLNSVLKLSALAGLTGRTRSETMSAVTAADFEKLMESV